MSDQVLKSPHQQAVDKMESMFLAKDPEPEAEPAPALSVSQEPEAPADGEPQGAEPGEQAELAAEPEVAEVEIDGEVYQVPAKIKDRFIHQADYTKKTQDLAELRRSLSAEREAQAIERAFEQETATERQQMTIMDAQLAQFKAVDWSGMSTEDLLRTRAQYDQLRDARAELDKSIQAKRGQFQQKIQSVRAQTLQAGQAYIAQHIKNFNETTQRELMEHGLQDGYLQDELSKLSDPRLVVTMWKAMQWDKLKASAPGVQNKASRAAPVVRPGASINQPTRKQASLKRFKDAKTPQEKRTAGEDYFAGFFGEGR